VSERFDVVVIGAGPGGEVAAGRLHSAGLHTAIVERELVGGECAYWACIPSKTLLRPPEVRFEARRVAGTAEPAQRWDEVARYRDFMIRNLDDAKQVEVYREQGVAVYKGAGKLAGPGRVQVGDESLETDRVVVATGTVPKVPPIDGLGQAGYWTNREATTLQEVPESVVILGGGPVGIELGQFLNRFGARVTLVEADGRLLAREDPGVSDLIAQELRADGVELHLGSSARAVSRNGASRTVLTEDGGEITASELLVAIGREPRVRELGLESVGIDAGPHGIPVDQRCRAADNVWAIGDVTGVMPFTHVAKYQARVACDDIVGRPAHADYSAIPRVVFSDPEVAAVGLTTAQARERGLNLSSSRVKLPEAISRPWTYERDPRGELAVLADRDRGTLIGAWAVSPLAGEWIHFAALAIKTGTPLAVLADTAPQFPTYSEGYLKAFERLED
jgi:pyruvate/2-oxoglutarate dehydrogenase complex dihydrolipoamide dehydrogenase (E3) component